MSTQHSQYTPPNVQPRRFHDNEHRDFRRTAGDSQGQGQCDSQGWGRKERETNRMEYRENNRNYHNYYGKQFLTKTISVQFVGCIIGMHGHRIRELKKITCTEIKIGKTVGNFTYLTIRGSQDAITKVECMIYNLIQNMEMINYQKNNHRDAHESRNSNNIAKKVLEWDKVDSNIKDANVRKMTPAEVAQWRKDNDVKAQRGFDDKADLRAIPNPALTFVQAFKDYPDIWKEIKSHGFQNPTPIQSQAWPILLGGDDLIVIAPNGTGKTLAFLLPAFIHIDVQSIPRRQRNGPTVLILVTTKELAIQCHKEVSRFRFKDKTSVSLYECGNYRTQIKMIKMGVDIVIATPGKLYDFIKQRHLSIINFSYIVVDNADRIFNTNLEPQIRNLLLDRRPNKQTVLISATWTNELHHIAKSYMTDPIAITVGSLCLEDGTTVKQILQFVHEVDKKAALYEFLYCIKPTDKVVIFCNTINLDFDLDLFPKGLECQLLNGGMIQAHRQAAFKAMVEGTVNILICMNVSTCGIDIKGVTHVVNYDFPLLIAEYLHRVALTGHAGKIGIALSFVTRKDWGHARELKKILLKANQEVPEKLAIILQYIDEQLEILRKKFCG